MPTEPVWTFTDYTELCPSTDHAVMVAELYVSGPDGCGDVGAIRWTQVVGDLPVARLDICCDGWAALLSSGLAHVLARLDSGDGPSIQPDEMKALLRANGFAERRRGE